MSDPTEGWAEKALANLLEELDSGRWAPAVLLPLLQQLEADEAALAINAHEAACHCDVICSTLTSLRALKRSLG